MTDSTIVLPQNQRFPLTNVSWLLDKRKGTIEKKSVHTIFLVCKGLTIDDVGGVSRDTVFQEIRPGAGFETGDFAGETLGGLPWNDSMRLKNLADK